MNIQKMWAQLQTLEEHTCLEAKPGHTIGPSIMETICAYSNTIGLGGGYILIGISENNTKPRKYTLTGVKDSEKIQNEIASQCRTKFNIPIRPEIKTGSIEGKTVIGVYVSEVDPGQKPLYIENLGPTKGAFIRVGPSDQKCTGEDLSAIYQARSNKSFDSLVLENLSIDVLNPLAIDEYRRLRRLVDSSAAELKLDDEKLLLSLKCISEVKGELHPTVTGVFLFGKRDVLHSEYPMQRFDYIRMPGTQWNPGLSKAYYTLEMNEGLFTLLPRAESAIMDDIPRTITLPRSGLIRDDYPIIPALVIREALVNAVMHRDYRTNSPTQVIRYSDRIEFRNPGHSLKPYLESGTPGSLLRNPNIANVLHDTKYAENKGTGISIMFDEMRKANLQVPTFESNRDTNTFVATVFVHNLANGEDITWLTQFKEHNLTNHEVRVLLLLKESGKVKNADCREIIQIDQLGMSYILQHLKSIGILDKHGGGAGVYYTLNQNYQMKASRDVKEQSLDETNELGLNNPKNKTKSGLTGIIDEKQGNESDELGLNNPKNKSELGLTGITYKRPGNESNELGLTNTKNNSKSGLIGNTVMVNNDVALNRTDLLIQLPEHLHRELEIIPGRLNKEEISNYIIRICSEGREFSPNQLAVILCRRRDWIMPYIQQMIVDGNLEPTIPENPGSRKQKYRSIRAKGQSDLGQF